MWRGLAKSGRGAVQAAIAAVALLSALVAVAAPAKRPIKRPAGAHAMRVQEPAGKRAKAGKAKPDVRGRSKPAPQAKAKAQRRRPKVDATTFDQPTVHRTQRAVAVKPAAVLQAGGLPASPPAGPRAGPQGPYAGTASSTSALPLPAAYSPVNEDDDAPEAFEGAAPVRSRQATVSHASELAEEAVQPMVLPGLYSRTGRLLVPAALKGSREVLVHQNVMADAAGLSRIEDDEDLARMRRLHLLVDLPTSASLRVNPQLNENRRCARPWTVTFAADTARAFHAKFGVALQLNSAARTVAYQRRLQRTNGNAAAVDGEAASPHLTGEAIDFGKRGMTLAEIAWMRTYLLPLMQAGKVDVEEEFQQACFHISVYKSYLPVGRAMPKNLAPKNQVPRSQMAQARPPRIGRSGR